MGEHSSRVFRFSLFARCYRPCYRKRRARNSPSLSGMQPSQIPIGCNLPRKRVLGSVPALWPYVLTNTTRIFQAYPNMEWRASFDYEIQDLDAVHQILSIERESFVGILKMRQ